jgi:hypothetical protein
MFPTIGRAAPQFLIHSVKISIGNRSSVFVANIREVSNSVKITSTFGA